MIGKSALLFISNISAATAFSCNNQTEALLQVKYDITQEEWDIANLPDGTGIRTSLPSLQISGDRVEYRSFNDLVDFETCLPRDDCTEVVVAGLPTDAYQISFDGVPVDIGPEFLFNGRNPITSTEVGNCVKPTCGDTEALVEVQYWTGMLGTNTLYRVEGQDGDIIIDSNTDVNRRRFNFELERTRACVPRDDACYTFVIGSPIQVDPMDFPPSYSLFYDGALVRKSESWLFDTAQFGGSCKPRCNQDSESLVQFFMFQNSDNCFGGAGDEQYKWDLSVAGRTPLEANLQINGTVPCTNWDQTGNTASLVHEQQCIPKDSCSTFRLTSPNVTVTSTTYSLVMDDVTYRKVQLFVRGATNQTTNMGSCTVGDLCDKQTQDLFDLELHTPATYKRGDVSSPMIGNNDINWAFFNHSAFNTRFPLFEGLIGSRQFNNMGYDVGSSYRTIECVPKGECDYTFGMTASTMKDGALESYTVRQNGVQRDDSREVDDQRSWSWIMTPFGQNCFATESHSLSSGAIVGIIIACLVVLSTVISLIVVCLNKSSEEQQNQTDKEDPLNENLL